MLRADEELLRDLAVAAPRAARRATSASWGVRWSRVSTVRLRACSPVASSSTRARSANASIPNSAEHLVSQPQFDPGVNTPAFTSQPLTVQQVRAGEVEPEARRLQVFDGLAIQGFGRIARAHERSRSRFDPQRPRGSRTHA